MPSPLPAATLALLSALLTLGRAASEPAPEITDFATSAQSGQVLALTTDDDGRVFAAVTERAFGRGTLTFQDDPALTAEDRQLRSVAPREQLVTSWLGTESSIPC